MGSHTATYAIAALAIALVCLFVGFLWGRSDLKSKIESALEKASVALDAREFAMRQQLDEAVAEVARLRPLAEELSAVQERLKREQSKYERMKADFAALNSGPASVPANQTEPEPPPMESADEAIHKLLQSLEAFNAPETGSAAASSEAAPQPASAVPAPVAAQPRKVEPVPPSPVAVAPASPPAQAPQPRTPDEAAKAAQTPAPVPRPQPPAQQQPKPAPLPPQKTIPMQAQNLTPAEPRKIPPPPAPKPAPAPTAKPGQPLDEWQEFARQLEALTGKKK